MQWRWTMHVFAWMFILSCLAFSIIWYIIALIHSDMEHILQMETDSGVEKNSTHIPCVTEIYGLTSAFLFSIETQTTIGNKDIFISKS